MKPRNLNQQFNLESLKVEGLKVIVHEQPVKTFKIQKSSIMVTSSIKFWKAMEKFDVSRSLF